MKYKNMRDRKVLILGSGFGGTLFTMSGDWTMGGKFLTILLDKLFIGKWLVRNFEDSLKSLKKQVEGRQAGG